jgi:hypothetical protein
MRNAFRSRFRWIFMLAIAVMVMVPFAAFADNVVDNVTVGGTDTFTAPGSTTIGYKINANGGDGQAGCNASDGSPATVALSVPAGVTASATSLTFTACNVFQNVTFSSSTAGNYAINVASISDSGAGSYNNEANWTLHVNAPIPSDTTKPVITPNVDGTLGGNGWYVTNVTVSWSVIDNESSISSQSGCAPTTINADTSGTTLTCSATSAGGTASQSVTIKRDATQPGISWSGDINDGDSFTYGSVPVAPTCTATDALSSPDTCVVAGYDASIGSHTLTATAKDNAGNIKTESRSYTVDKATLTGSFTAADKMYDGTTTATITNRSLTGVVGSDDVSLTGGTASFADANVGANKTVTGAGFTLAGADAGNYVLGSVANTTASITYAPTGANCYGGPGRTILQPINVDGTSVFKQGSTVPAKFRVCDAFANSIGTPGVVTSFKLIQTISGTTSSSVNEEVTSTSADSSFRWSAGDQQWIFNISTKNLKAGQTYVYEVKLNDGTSFTFRFGLR